MGAKSVQISLDEQLLKQLDEDPETSQRGRSAVIRRALRLYLDLKQRRTVDQAYVAAYAGKAEDVLSEFGYLVGTVDSPTE